MPDTRRQDPIVRVARALGDPTRLRVLLAIAARGEVSCQELTGMFRIAQATVSHHLKVLTEAGLVSARKEGPFHWYRAHPEAVAAHGRALARALPAGRAASVRPERRRAERAGVEGRPRPAERRAPPRR
jgi:ArsR family transcriptional regulator